MANEFVINPAVAPIGNPLAFDFAALKQVAQHALGKDTVDPTTDLGTIVNTALSQLAAAHPWRWLERPLTLDFVADTTLIPLPHDFQSFSSIERRGGAGLFEAVTLQRIMELRHGIGPVIVTGRWLWSLTWIAQEDSAGLPRPGIEVWPTPPADEADALIGTYLRHLSMLTEDSHVPDIPAPFQPLARQFVRALAAAEDNRQSATQEYQVLAGMLPRYIELDGRGQSNLGPIQGPTPPRRFAYTPNISPAPSD